MRNVFVCWWVLSLAMWLACPVAQFSKAQQNFAPESSEVKSVVDRAVEYLTNINPSGEKGVLAGLAIAEASKRYGGLVPKDHPVIKKAISGIIKGVDSGNLLRAHAMYHPCLAMILLCEVDDKKYRPQIEKLIKSFEERQLDDGGFTYHGSKSWDTSQTQYVALAYFVARQHQIPVSLESTRRILEFVIAKQTGNTWTYTSGQRGQRVSIHAALSGTAYLLGDLLRLQPRLKVEKKVVEGLGADLPPSISVHIVAQELSDNASAEAAWSGDGPLVDINSSSFKSCKQKANQHFENVFVLKAPQWSYYYLYAFERYAFFRQQAEGDIGNRAMKSWYDDCFAMFKEVQKEDGSMPKGPESTVSADINTSFAIMFLVRSSEILSIPPAGSNLEGGGGLGKTSGKALKELKNGRIRAEETSKNLNELIENLGEELSNDQLETLSNSIKDAIREYQAQPEKSRGQARAFLRSLVSDKNYYKRLIGVKFLAGEQDLDNAPALIYAMGDPDVRVCMEAHNGLRLVSRKIDSITVPEKPTLSDFQLAKDRWVSWLKKLRPDAELLD